MKLFYQKFNTLRKKSTFVDLIIYPGRAPGPNIIQSGGPGTDIMHNLKTK